MSYLVLKMCFVQIVDKALEEPKYSSLYAQLCLRLAEDAPNFDGPAAEGQPGQKQSTVSGSVCFAYLQVDLKDFLNKTCQMSFISNRHSDAS